MVPQLARLDPWRPTRRDLSPDQWRWVGTGATAVVAATSWLCAATPKEFSSVWPGVIPWRSNGGSPLAATALILGVVVLLYAWWGLRDASVSVSWLRRTTAAWSAPLLLSAPLFSRDIYSYAVTGLQLHLGGNPYHEGVRHLASSWVSSVSRVWLDTPAPYGPLFLVLARGAATVADGRLLVALAVLRLLAVAAVVVLAWAVPAIARGLGTDPTRATWLAVLTPLVAMHAVAGAHNDTIMVAGVAAAFALALRGTRASQALACLVVAAAIAVKVPAVVAVPFLALLVARDTVDPAHRTWLRYATRAILVGIATIVASLAICLGTGLGFDWVSALDTPGDSVQWTSLPTGLGMGVGALGTLVGHNVEHPAVSAFRTVALVVLGVTLVGIWLRAVRSTDHPREVVRYAGLALVAMIVLSPAFHGWYLLWVLPLLAPVVGRTGATALAAVSSLLCLSVLPGGFSLALDTSWVGVPLCFVAAFLLVRAATRRLRTLSWRVMTTLDAPAAHSDGAHR